MNTKIFHTVNAGLYLWGAETGILVDGLHRGKEIGFSDTPTQVLEQLKLGQDMFDESHLHAVVFTHNHSDHYDQASVSVCADQLPSTVFFSPQHVQRGPVQDACDSIFFGHAVLTMFPTLHDGVLFENDPHCSFMISMGSERFFIAGDAILNEDLGRIISQLYGGVVTGAFFNLYQLASKESQSFLQYLRPERIFLYHLPFIEDDNYAYSHLAEKIVRRLPEEFPRVEILPHMAWIDNSMADWFDSEVI